MPTVPLTARFFLVWGILMLGAMILAFFMGGSAPWWFAALAGTTLLVGLLLWYRARQRQ